MAGIFSPRILKIQVTDKVKPCPASTVTGFRNVVGAQRLELWTDGLRVRCSTN